jgi:hypothetical protein
MTTSTAGRVEGERRRDHAHGLLHAARAALIRRIQRAYLLHLLDHGPATIDAVRQLVPIPPGIDPRVVGAAVHSLATAGLIVSVGRQKSCRPKAHARKLDRWDIADRAGAAAWLATHPEPPGLALPLYPELT